MIETAGRAGYHDASITDVTGRAGVSRKTFYTHFEDKEHCFIAAYRQAIGQVLERCLDAAAIHDGWAAQVRAGLHTLLNGLAEEPAVARVCFVEVMGAGPAALTARNDAMSRFTALFDTGPSEAALSLPDKVALSMAGALSEVLYREIAAGGAAGLPGLLPELMFTMVLPVLGREAAEEELHRGERLRAANGGASD
jgi:AcrR family transcriptional regulator